jgi:ATP-binding cassette subfamily F protein 2
MSKRRKDNKKKQQNTKAENPVPNLNEEDELNGENGTVSSLVKEAEKLKISPRAVTGVLTSQFRSRDIKLENFSLSLHGHELIKDTKLEFNWGRRYGFIGLNGSGKSTMLKCLGERELPIPSWMSVFLLEKEVPPSEMTALEAVICDVDQEVKRLEAEAEEVAITEGPDSERLSFLYECLDELDPDTIIPRAGNILHGLGFTKQMQKKKTKDFSGGWRMRVALARALFIKPMMLLLDEPTNHLDLEACVWLEEYLKNYNRILVIISHSQDFLNGVCTNIIHLYNQKLVYYGGNYDQYVQTRSEKEENQMKQFNWEQDQIKHMKEYIARFGHGSAKLARQAQSKEKTLARMEEGGLTERVVKDKVVTFTFIDCGKLPPPVLQFNHVHFGYTENPKDEIYSDLDFGVDLDSRVALVGPNGTGKSTLIKLMVGNVMPTKGMVRRHHRLRIAWYHQHLTEQLDLSLTPLQFMMKSFPEEVEEEKMRRVVGRFGITGKDQTTPMKQLSDGLKSRVVFSWLAWKEPHLLLLDEPTNHLDIETIDSLADAINNFDGGMVLVSHDFRLINQVAKEIWVCENKNIKVWKGDIQEYKEVLRKKLADETEK